MRFEVTICDRETCGLVPVQVWVVRSPEESQRSGLGKRLLRNDRGTLHMTRPEAEAFKSIVESQVVTLTTLEDYGPLAPKPGRNGTRKE